MILALCQAESCIGRGAAALAGFAQGLLGIGWNETTVEGGITLLRAECIGLCNGGPCASLNGRSLVRLTPARLAAALGLH